VKWPGRGTDHQPPSVTEVANEFEAVPKYVAGCVLVEFVVCCYSDNSRGVVVMMVVVLVGGGGGYISGSNNSRSNITMSLMFKTAHQMSFG
jgi:hypothetical protein